MISKKKVLLGVLIVILIVPVFEFLREYGVYRIGKYKLNVAAQQLKYNMTRKEVTQLMGPPSAIFEADSQVNARIYIDIWSWKSEENQGFLWQRLGLNEYTPPLEITAFFDGDEIIFAMIEEK